jgi:hypothetical protein
MQVEVMNLKSGAEMGMDLVKLKCEVKMETVGMTSVV